MKEIKVLRLRQQMTQAELAQRMGITQSLVAMWERDASMPSAAKLPELANVLHCTIDELYGRQPPGQDGT